MAVLERVVSIVCGGAACLALACVSAPTPEPEAEAPVADTPEAEVEAPVEDEVATPVDAPEPEAKASSGELDAATKQALSETIRAYLPELQTCYEKELDKNSKLAGKMTYTITVERTGSVRGVNVDLDTVESEAVRGCTLEKIEGWKFDASDLDEPADVTFSVDFQAV